MNSSSIDSALNLVAADLAEHCYRRSLLVQVAKNDVRRGVDAWQGEIEDQDLDDYLKIVDRLVAIKKQLNRNPF